MKIKSALYIAAGILIASALISRFEEKKLLFALLLNLAGIAMLAWAHQKVKTRAVCTGHQGPMSRVPWINQGKTLILLGLGFGAFSLGRIIYLLLT